MSRRGLFLDLDGTLADSHAMLRDVYARVLDEIGVGADGPTFEAMAAFPLTEVVERLCAGREGADPSALLADYQRWVREGYEDVPVREGGGEVLDWAKDAGYRTAIVTSAPDALCTAWLAHRGLRVDAVIGADSATPAKPDPAPYLAALERTGCDASASAAVEDSPGGARSAFDAGLRTFVLGAPGDADWPPVAGHLDRLVDIRTHLS